jgi:hypothetical protein
LPSFSSLQRRGEKTKLAACVLFTLEVKKKSKQPFGERLFGEKRLLRKRVGERERVRERNS